MAVTLTKIRKVLRDAAVNPRKPGPIRIIADVGNPDYYDNRAIEAIKSGDRGLALTLLALAQATVLDQSDQTVGPGPRA